MGILETICTFRFIIKYLIKKFIQLKLEENGLKDIILFCKESILKVKMLGCVIGNKRGHPN